MAQIELSEQTLDRIWAAFLALYADDGVPPTTRVLASEVGLSSTTIHLAMRRYRELGLVRSSRHRRGVWVPRHATVVLTETA